MKSCINPQPHRRDEEGKWHRRGHEKFTFWEKICHRPKDAADKLLICSRGKLFFFFEYGGERVRHCATPPSPARQQRAPKAPLHQTRRTADARQTFPTCTSLPSPPPPDQELNSRLLLGVLRIVPDLATKLGEADSSQYRMTDLGFHHRPASDPENRCAEL